MQHEDFYGARGRGGGGHGAPVGTRKEVTGVEEARVCEGEDGVGFGHVAREMVWWRCSIDGLRGLGFWPRDNSLMVGYNCGRR